jgi:hypothetical protein
MRRLVFSVALVSCALVALPALAAVGGNRIVGDCTKSQVRPSTVVLACADGNAYVNHIKWKGFGGASSSGSGSYTLNTCKPYCAAGKFVSYPVDFTATQAKPCPDHQDDYRQLSVTFLAARPQGFGRHHSTTLFCPIP